MPVSITPKGNPVILGKKKDVLLAKEWAWDFDGYCFARNREGQMYKVTENEAIKVWIWKLFKTARWYEIVHTDNYGTDLWGLIGNSYSTAFIESEAARIVRENIELNLSDYIRSIGHITVKRNRGKLHINLPITTIYSDKEEVIEFEA